MSRRIFLSQLLALPFAGLFNVGAQEVTQGTHRKLKVMMKSAWGSDDPTKAAFPFLHGLALAEAGHEVQIFLLGEAVSLMRKSVATAVVPVGWRRFWGLSKRSSHRTFRSTRVGPARGRGA